MAATVAEALNPPDLEPLPASLLAVLWDVDGTLAETERDGHRRAFNRAFAEAGLPLRWDAEAYAPWLTISGGAERIRAALQQLEGIGRASCRERV